MIEAKDLTKRYGDTLAVDGRHVHDPSWPLREVGALLESRSIHPGRSAQAHLQMRMTQRHGIAGLLGDHSLVGRHPVGICAGLRSVIPRLRSASERERREGNAGCLLIGRDIGARGIIGMMPVKDMMKFAVTLMRKRRCCRQRQNETKRTNIAWNETPHYLLQGLPLARARLLRLNQAGIRPCIGRGAAMLWRWNV